MKISKLKSFLAALFALPMLVAPSAAKAQSAAGILIFYGAIKLSEAQAVRATANYYEAIGMSAQAQKYTRLAADFQSGSLGGSDGIKAFVQCSNSVERDISELQAAGVYPTERQKELVKKARAQLTTAKVALGAAVVAGTATVLNSGDNMFVKIAMGVIMAAESAKVLGAIKRVHEVAHTYDSYQLGGSNGFQIASKDVQPQFVDL